MSMPPKHTWLSLVLWLVLVVLSAFAWDRFAGHGVLLRDVKALFQK
jgi:hypothetical protein